jgi:hypothetical protein
MRYVTILMIGVLLSGLGLFLWPHGPATGQVTEQVAGSSSGLKPKAEISTDQTDPYGGVATIVQESTPPSQTRTYSSLDQEPVQYNTYSVATRRMPGGPADPELERLNQEDRTLEIESQRLVAAYRKAKEGQEQSGLRRQLADVVTRHFDVRQQRREREVAQLEERIRRIRESIDARQSSREELIQLRLEQLIREADGLAF